MTSAAAITLIATGANAADLMSAADPVMEAAAPMAAYDWSGIYAGVQGGYGSANGYHVDTLGTRSDGFDIEGGLIGGTLGYNWQRNQMVFGVEGDIAKADIDGSTTAGCSVVCYTDIDALATARARIGYAYGKFLPYVTGGAAFAQVKAGQVTGGFGSDEWISGWTAGGGVEVGVNKHLSLKAEALYVDLNDSSYTVSIPVAAPISDFVVVRGGLNWHF
jgi:outer membrane immunogenic protein